MPSIAYLSSELYDVDDSLAAANVARQTWLHALQEVADKARAKLPDAGERIDKALKIVLSGDIEVHDDGTASVRSQTNGVQLYQLVNGHCDCVDFAHAPGGWCKHRLSAAFAKRAQALLPIPQTPLAEPEVNDSMEANPEEHPAGIPAQYIVSIKGKLYPTYQGLLIAAQAQGLVKLEARFISVTDSLALAEATATFSDGRVYTEAGDATPANVGTQVKLHFARMALTRSKARCLRDALGMMCAAEELAE